jgi:hypothetical protein
MSDLNDHLTGPNAMFLRKKFFVQKLYEYMEPNLAFTGLFPAQPIDSRSVIVTKEASSKSADAKKVWPKKLTESSEWPGISISSMTQDSAMLQKYGFELRIGEDYLKLQEGAGIIKRAMDRTAFWMAQFREYKIATALIADGTALGANWAPTAAWSDSANSTPLQDLIKFKRSMRKVNKAFACTDIFVNTADYNDLELWLIDVNADLAKRQLIGQTTVGENSVYIPALKATVHRIDEGVAEGEILGIDGLHEFATYYYYNDAKYGSPSVTYTTRDGQKTVPGLGLNLHQFFDDNKMEIVNKLWFDFVFDVGDAEGTINDTGI